MINLAVTNISTTTDTHLDTARRRQGRVALALADLLTLDLSELSWYAPRNGSSIPTLRGVRDGEGGDTSNRVDVVDEWARFLRVTPVWEELAGGSGEYIATGWHMGVRVTVRAFLTSAPLAVRA
ncbi:hypothetical protein [Microtetraspora malaysiensis]|uniref:Uncharacterized protein n=1 Tax=Microtetraspora malaysiensis TaxID=161358 RepID=A0ABW6SKC3_9ACTN